MFGFESVRTKSTKAGIAALQPMMGVLQSIGSGIPSGMWEDPYIIGFTQMIISFRAKIATDGKARGVDLGQALVDVYSAVSHMNGAAIVKDAARLLEQRHPEYMRGANDGITIQEYTFDMLKNEKIPLVVQALTDAQAMGKSDHKGTVIAIMMQATWLKEVQRLIGRK